MLKVALTHHYLAGKEDRQLAQLLMEQLKEKYPDYSVTGSWFSDNTFGTSYTISLMVPNPQQVESFISYFASGELRAEPSVAGDWQLRTYVHLPKNPKQKPTSHNQLVVRFFYLSPSSNIFCY